MLTTFQTSNEIISLMQQLVPAGSPQPQDAKLLDHLSYLTQDLIQAYEASGRVQADPFEDVWIRSLHLYEQDVRNRLCGKTVLVTGGEGFVGTKLIAKLVELGARRIVSIDNVRCDASTSEPIPGIAANVALYAADVRNITDLRQIFAKEKPAIVFHLGAIRLPSLGEKKVLETVTSNIFGTLNIVQVCEEFEVKQCVFSSTGKSSRYWTGEVYAATKKINEWLFAQAAEVGKVQYSMVRFTHMLNNSSMIKQIDDKIQSNQPIHIHAPDRYVVGQNVGEAVHLLLNSLVFAQPNRLRFILVRNLGWPVESLEVALYKLKQSGKKLPIYFQGLPPGYEEPFFIGQVDWSKKPEINTLINALETGNFATLSSSQDMIVSEVTPFSTTALNYHIEQLKQLCNDPQTLPAVIKQQLGKAVFDISKTAFLNAPTQRCLQILKWGINLKKYQQDESYIKPFQPYIELIVESIYHRLTTNHLSACGISLLEFEHLLTALQVFPTLKENISLLRNRF